MLIIKKFVKLMRKTIVELYNYMWFYSLKYKHNVIYVGSPDIIVEMKSNFGNKNTTRTDVWVNRVLVLRGHQREAF